MASEASEEWYRQRISYMRKRSQELGLTLQEYMLFELLYKLEDVESETDDILLRLERREGEW